MKYQITLNNPTDIERQDGEEMPIYLRNIIQQLLSNSAQRQLGMNFTEQNQLIVAEEIGYRRALLDLSNFYQENNT